jgi:L-asparaginase II
MNRVKADVCVYRGEYLESAHQVHVAVVDHEGNLLYACGDPDRPTFARSAMKPLQAVPVIETGAADAFGFGPEHVALCCASHSGEPLQRERVLAMLGAAGLTEEYLQCGTHVPRHTESYHELVRAGKPLTPVYCNCSGKHAGMLVTAVHMNEDPRTYDKPEHPVQQRILDAISRYCDVPAERIETATDGCGVPVHRLPLRAIALGYARLAAWSGAGRAAAYEDAAVGENADRFGNPPGSRSAAVKGRAARAITSAMTAHPDMVAGRNRLDTDLMRAFRGRLFSKSGAEAVQCFGDLERGIGIAVKIEDGGSRALDAASMRVLELLGIGDARIYAQLDAYRHPKIENMRGEQVGRIEAVFELQAVN